MNQEKYKKLEELKEGEIENAFIMGKISSTSDKQTDKFEVKDPKKSVFIEVDENNKLILEEFGMTQYTSEDGVNFFVAKASAFIKRFDGEKELKQISGRTKVNGGGDNFSINEEVGLGIMRGKKSGNTFMRLFMIDCPESAIEFKKFENPFARK